MKWLAITVSLVVLAAVIAAFTVVGSPAKQRLVRFDDRKISDLQSIQSQVNYFYQTKSAMPKSLSELNSLNSYVVPTDPQTNQAYEYRVKTGTTYELCATFNQTSSESQNYPDRPIPYSGYDSWPHGVGRTCFERTVDSSIRKPLPL